MPNMGIDKRLKLTRIVAWEEGDVAIRRDVEHGWVVLPQGKSQGYLPGSGARHHMPSAQPRRGVAAPLRVSLSSSEI
ncbi:MAG: hypothetical protein ACE5JM_15540 [Armatimonadota bacterium]